MYGFFAHGTDPPPRPYSSGFLSLLHRLRRLPSPTHFRRRSLGHAAFAALQVLHSRPSTGRASLALSLPLIGPPTPVPPGDSVSPPEVTRCSSVPSRAVRFIVGAAPIDYGPGLLLMPFGFHLA